MKDRLQIQVIDIRDEAPDVKTYKFKPLNAHTIEFKPGQFVLLYADIQNNGITERVKRSYSITSSPLEKEHIELTIQKIPNGKLTPHFIDNVSMGDIFEISNAQGKFIYSDDIKNIVLIAGGTGISPMRSIMKYCVEKGLNTKITLIYSTRSPDYILYKNDLEDFDKNPNINIIYTMTGPSDNWTGQRGRINNDIIMNNVQGINTNTYYLCGSLDFIRTIVNILRKLGVDRKKIKRDVWF